MSRKPKSRKTGIELLRKATKPPAKGLKLPRPKVRLVRRFSRG
jgi:hypothetical protein